MTIHLNRPSNSSSKETKITYYSQYKFRKVIKFCLSLIVRWQALVPSIKKTNFRAFLSNKLTDIRTQVVLKHQNLLVFQGLNHCGALLQIRATIPDVLAYQFCKMKQISILTKGFNCARLKLFNLTSNKHISLRIVLCERY